MKPIRTVAVFPAMFTLANLVCGFFAIVVAARVELPTQANPPATYERVMSDFDSTDENHNLMLCGWLIFLAMVFDALDGHVARLARAPTEFGAQLDSLADMVTFGVAPAILLVKMCHRFTFLHVDHTIQPVWLIAATYAACVALRLARFNVESDEEDDHMQFNGLPSPAAAGAVAGFAILFYYLRLDESRIPAAAQIDTVVQMALPFYGLVLAVLMVSRIPYPHVVNQVFRGQRSFGHVVALVLGLLVVMAVREVAVPLLFLLFVIAPRGGTYGIASGSGRLIENRCSSLPMFTGLIESLATVAAVLDEPPGKRLVVRAPPVAAEAVIGESIAVSGCCLTVVAINSDTIAFQAGAETLSRTTLGELRPGSAVNLERSLRVGDRLGGHFVTGHIDAVGKLIEDRLDGEWRQCWFQTPAALTTQMAAKGSIAVDGVSLTLVDVELDRFSVALIPHTLWATTLGKLRIGDRVNLETDILAKYMSRGRGSGVGGQKE